MRKLIIIVILMAGLLLPSCAVPEPDRLLWQTYPFVFGADAEIGGSRYVLRGEAGSEFLKISFSEPSQLAGFVFTVPYDGGNILVTYGELSFSCGEAGYDTGLASIARLFSLKRDDFIGADLMKISGMTLNTTDFSVEGGHVRVFVSPDTGLPCRFEGEIHGNPVTLNITSFEYETEYETTEKK